MTGHTARPEAPLRPPQGVADRQRPRQRAQAAPGGCRARQHDGASDGAVDSTGARGWVWV